MKLFKDEAASVALLFDLGLITCSELIDWADQAIMEQSKPGIELIDLSLCSQHRRDEICDALRKLSAGADEWNAIELAMPRILEVVSAAPERAADVARFFYKIALEHEHDVPVRFRFFITADDDFDLAEAGVFVTSEIYQKFVDDIRILIPLYYI